MYKTLALRDATKENTTTQINENLLSINERLNESVNLLQQMTEKSSRQLNKENGADSKTDDMRSILMEISKEALINVTATFFDETAEIRKDLNKTSTDTCPALDVTEMKQEIIAAMKNGKVPLSGSEVDHLEHSLEGQNGQLERALENITGEIALGIKLVIQSMIENGTEERMNADNFCNHTTKGNADEGGFENKSNSFKSFFCGRRNNKLNTLTTQIREPILFPKTGQHKPHAN